MQQLRPRRTRAHTHSNQQNNKAMCGRRWPKAAVREGAVQQHPQRRRLKVRQRGDGRCHACLRLTRACACSHPPSPARKTALRPACCQTTARAAHARDCPPRLCRLASSPSHAQAPGPDQQEKHARRPSCSFFPAPTSFAGVCNAPAMQTPAGVRLPGASAKEANREQPNPAEAPCTHTKHRHTAACGTLMHAHHTMQDALYTHARALRKRCLQARARLGQQRCARRRPCWHAALPAGSDTKAAHGRCNRMAPARAATSSQSLCGAARRRCGGRPARASTPKAAPSCTPRAHKAVGFTTRHTMPLRPRSHSGGHQLQPPQRCSGHDATARARQGRIPAPAPRHASGLRRGPSCADRTM